MGTLTKTDNGNIGAKLALRRHFLGTYHRAGRTRVFDACQGEGVIWSALRREFPLAYYGVDKKPKRGRVAMDSVRLLLQDGWNFDVIDIDTYGSPWEHWFSILPKIKKPTTVFLTIGAVMHHGAVSKAALAYAGLGAFEKIMPQSFARSISDFVTELSLGAFYEAGLECTEGREAAPGPRVRYLGLHLTPGKN